MRLTVETSFNAQGLKSLRRLLVRRASGRHSLAKAFRFHAVRITAGELLMTDIDARLREDVHLLGELLGNTIRDQYGEEFLDKIEQIRKGAKADRVGSMDAELSASLNQLSEDELLPV